MCVGGLEETRERDWKLEQLSLLVTSLVHTLHSSFLHIHNSSFPPRNCKANKHFEHFYQSHLPQVFLRLTEPLRAVHAVLDAASVDGVVVLVVQ